MGVSRRSGSDFFTHRVARCRHAIQGKIEYYNWWGGIVFAPFAIVIGSLGLLIATFKPSVFLETAKKKTRFGGWPKGRSRYQQAMLPEKSPFR